MKYIVWKKILKILSQSKAAESTRYIVFIQIGFTLPILKFTCELSTKCHDSVIKMLFYLLSNLYLDAITLLKHSVFIDIFFYES